MQTLLLWVARLSGLAGVAICAVAAALRLSGNYWIAGVQTITLFQVGIGAMVLGCLAYLARLAERSA